ncbi:hypothetical protein JG687_00009260 [Phytophthora cactorum]|uniref:Uncharacterized protein n=1 Tax=Phytophthora cactorum TaxID=29920 RepID=A0A8T1UA88_9STRA|nr:hypothetical protein JG687_00009260 [Phytophthora cactorum]
MKRPSSAFGYEGSFRTGLMKRASSLVGSLKTRRPKRRRMPMKWRANTTSVLQTWALWAPLRRRCVHCR